MKKVISPVIGREKTKTVQKYENVPIAVINVDKCTIDGQGKVCKKMSLFYSKLFEKYNCWVESAFKRYAQNLFINDNSPRKRFRYTPLELIFLSEAEIKDDYFLYVTIRICIQKGKEIVSEKYYLHIWNLQKGYLTLPRKKRGIRCGKNSNKTK